MDLAYITPTHYLERFSKRGDIYLALAHLVDNKGENKYATFHRREASKGHKVILDNGLFEGKQVDAEVLLQRAAAIGASVVCAPDLLYDSQGTIKEFKRFIKLKREFGLVCQVMGVPQADNPDDWWDCFRFMELSKDCDLIGLSILSIPECFRDLSGASFERPITDSRMYIIRQLFAYQTLLGRPITKCHLLGIGESYADIILANKILPDVVISNDSSSAFMHGKHEVLYNSFGGIPGGKIKTKIDFDCKSLTNDQIKAIDHNIDIANNIKTWELKSWLKTVEV